MSTEVIPAGRYSVAPMMDWTDRHCRAFHRVLSRRALLYTEMVTTGAILHGPRARLLGYDPSEHPVAVQLAGSDPRDLAEAARIAEGFGYDEVNLNCGCPSDRVQNGRFGACLMREPMLVAECVAAMKAAVRLPVTVKCRLGVDDQDPREALFSMVECRRCVRCRRGDRSRPQGLAPGPVAEGKSRRAAARLWARVTSSSARGPQLFVAINGGIADNDAAAPHLAVMDGVMLGRAAYQNPELLLDVDARFFGGPRPVADAFNGARRLRALRGGTAAARRAAARHDAPSARSVRRAARRARLAAASRDRGAEGGSRISRRSMRPADM